MMTAVIVAIVFGITMVLETSAVQSLPPPYSAFPLMLIAGVIVLHRTDAVLGIAWLLLMALFADAWGEGSGAILPFLIASALAVPLKRRVFTNRSVYALLGMGLSVQVVLIVTATLLSLAHTVFSDTALYGQDFVATRFRETLLLLGGLYLSAMGLRSASHWLKRTFYVNM